MEYYRPNIVPPASLLVRDTGLLLLRLAAGIALPGYHAWAEGGAGWKYLWEKTPWPFAAEMAERGFPVPGAVSFAVVVVAIAGSVFLITGLLGRMAALALALLTLCGLFLYGGIPDLSERLLLYAVIYTVLVICGPGFFSLDAVLSGRRRPFKR